jgi:hypothetical protein
MTEDCERYITQQLDAGKIGQFKSEDPARIREIENTISSTLKRYHYL